MTSASAIYEHAQQLMPFPTHVVRTRRLVADRETELRALFDFLGLDWHDAVLDHQDDREEARPDQDGKLRAGDRADLYALRRPLGELSQISRAGASGSAALDRKIRLYRLRDGERRPGQGSRSRGRFTRLRAGCRTPRKGRRAVTPAMPASGSGSARFAELQATARERSTRRTRRSRSRRATSRPC